MDNDFKMLVKVYRCSCEALLTLYENRETRCAFCSKLHILTDNKVYPVLD